ncbi:hypothetical protein KBD20_02520 [Candidatus Saccharibacteria bacterium]|nr:hypothetical protein [Candidatus Saccharibacteria bacterium]
MSIICPTITAENTHVYREQIERVQSFAPRIHIDLMDGMYTKNKSISLNQVWWPENITADIHLMYQNPITEIESLVKLRPDLVTIHLTDEVNVAAIAEVLHTNSIRCGLVLMPDTTVASMKGYLHLVDQVLIFSGNLGHQGGSTADLTLLSRVEELLELAPNLEVAWDGGVNTTNIKQISDAGVTVINTGGFVQSAVDPRAAYDSLVSALK